MRTFQQLVLALQDYWGRKGCAILQPYDMEVGAGTSHTATFLRAIGPEPWRAAYVQPTRRPKDGRYGENPNRLQHYYQFQVVLKPSPADIIDLYLGSLEALGIDPKAHDIRLVEDVLHALQVHGESLDAVGDLAGDRLAVEPANLLEIGELGDFHAV